MCYGRVKVGDEVSWKWGGGHPSGVVKDVKTSGQLEIESNGKRVHKNADEGNPAVHVEREGNDVVKRESELHRLRGGVARDNTGETAVQEQVAETEVPKRTTRSSKRGGRQTTAETRKKQSEAGKKGAAARKAAAAGKGRRGKAAVAAEEAAVGEKREREEVVEEAREKEGQDINMEKGEKERVEVTTEQEKAELEAGKEPKKARIATEGAEYVPDEVPGEDEDAAGEEEERSAEEQKLVEPTGPTPTTEEIAGAASELKELERDNQAYGLDTAEAGSQPRPAAQTALEGIAIEASVEAGSTDVLERMEAITGAAEEPVQSQTSEKKRGGKRGGRTAKASS